MRWPANIAGSVALACAVLSEISGAVVPVDAAAPARTVTQLLTHADDIKTSNHAEFTKILQQVTARGPERVADDSGYLKYLRAWELGYGGNYPKAIKRLEELSARAADPALRYRAEATIVNFLQVSARYESALSRLNALMSALPGVSDERARQQILGVASGVYNDVGNHELALMYSRLREKEALSASDQCHARHGSLTALAVGEGSRVVNAQLRNGIALCMRAKDALFANAIRALLVRRMLDVGKSSAAIEELTSHYDEVQQTQYAELIAKVDSLLALAYWDVRDLDNARRHATKALRAGVLDKGTKSFGRAYRVLYLVAKQRGDDAAALAWHEKYMTADTAYLNEVSAKALAFQKVNQQVLAKERRIEALNDQNRILGLQQTLSEKAAETTRLYVALLVVILSAVAFWAWRTKRSQIAFRKQARRDSLTGIFNRQHFMEAARTTLQYGSKSARESCLILLDLDHFKQVNDDHGHATGDTVLKRAVAACQNALRSVDVFGRLGGEEFGILLPDCGVDDGAERAERMRRAIAALVSDDMPEVTASFGVASSLDAGTDLRKLLAHADAALYRAKRSGRNTVGVFDGEQYPADAIAAAK